MNTHISHCRQLSLTSYRASEHRLCRNIESPDRAYEALEAGRQITGNPHLNEVLQSYTSIIQHEFNNPADRQNYLSPGVRTNFFALLLRGMLRTVTPATVVNMLTGPFAIPASLLPQNGVQNYTVNARTNINAIDPFALQAVPGGLDAQQTSKLQKEWVDTSGTRIPFTVLRRNIQEYITWRNDLNALLRNNSVPFAQEETVDAPYSTATLSRNVHFELLALWSSGDARRKEITNIVSIAGTPAERIQRITKYIEGLNPQIRNELQIHNRIRTDITLNAMGNTEFLSRFGIIIGSFIRKRYLDQRMAGGNNVPNAALWEAQPMLAHQFLSTTQFAELDTNRDFLQAIDFHFGPNSSGRAPTDRAPNNMQRRDVQVGISLIVQSLTESDVAMTNSTLNRVDLRNRVGIDRQIEEQAARIWEYIKEFRDHPIGSLLMGATAFIVIRSAWNLIFKRQNRNIWNYLAYGAAGTIAYSLYQEHQTGTSYLRQGINSVDSFVRSQFNLPPNQRAATHYWERELGLTDQRQKACLSILEEQPAGPVFDWYRQMTAARANGGNVPLPFALSGRLREIFGQLPDSQIQELFYTTLRKFFIHRGRAARSGGWQIENQNTTGNQDELDAAVGEDYLRQIFIERRFFRSVTAQLLRTQQLQYNGQILSVDTLLQQWTLPEFQTYLRSQLPPGLYSRVATCRYILVQEDREVSTSTWNMYYIFTLQMDEGAAARTTGTPNIFGTFAHGARNVEEWILQGLRRL